ncbi:MAG: DNA repair protein RadC [Bacilli bacterium]|nr:DNA repair protein RadC [Bacilli bacterium]
MNYRMKEIPKEERPRERLIKEGVDKLSNEELISIILKTGTKDKNVKNISIEILQMAQNITDLKNITVPALKTIKGVGEVKAIELIATIELGKRIFLAKAGKDNIKMCNPKEIWNMTRYLFYGKKQEYFYCLYLNNKQELIERKLLFMGTINRSIVHPREVFKEAYLVSASNIICMHNHPSGDVTPSKEDLYFTKNLAEIGKMQGIPIIDHIIVSDDSYYSFYENKDIFIC